MNIRAQAALAALALGAGLMTSALAVPISPYEKGYLSAGGNNAVDEVKGVSPPSIGLTPSLTGGPDAWGYTYTDSTEAGGPTYSFYDISGTGTPVALGDDAGTTVPLGFSFFFYGVPYTQASASSNGYITFGGDSTDFTNDCPLVEGGLTPPLSIFAYWDDLDPGDDGALLYHQQFASCPVGDAVPCTIVQWEEYDFFPGDGNPGGNAGTFQAILYENGNILFQYEGGPGLDGSSATVGIWEDTVANSLLYQCNGGAISGGLAVEFGLPPTGDLSLTKTGAVALGGPFSYTLEVTNLGPDDQTGVAVTDNLPAELQYLGDSCNNDFIDGVWNVGDLANGASASCTLMVILADQSACTTVVNTATVTGDLFDPASGSSASVGNGGGEAFQDPGFEAGTPSPVWGETSTNFGTPLCTVSTCGTGTGTGPRTGDWWAWFGGTSAFEEGTVSQDVIIPPSAGNLEFWLEAIVCSSPGDFLEVTIDGTQVFYVDGTWSQCGVLGYSQQSVDVSAFADGGNHTVVFHSVINNPGEGVTNFFVDDVSLSGPPVCPANPAPPALAAPTLQAAGYALLVLMLAGIGFMRRGRRK